MAFTKTDGGRTEAGYRNPRGGQNNDCVVRSISIASGRPYAQVYEEITACIQAGGFPQDRAHARKNPATHILVKGVSGIIWIPYITKAPGGWDAVTPARGRTMFRPENLPAEGPVLVLLSGHLTVVVDGVLHDTHDCMKSGRRRIKQYYVPKKEIPMAMTETVTAPEAVAVEAPAPEAVEQPKPRGRRPIPPGVERRANVNMSLPYSEVERLRALGGGSASAGVSKLLAMYASQNGSDDE
jgi:hypothetical protein